MLQLLYYHLKIVRKKYLHIANLHHYAQTICVMMTDGSDNANLYGI